jgi:hypothetical protein
MLGVVKTCTALLAARAVVGAAAAAANSTIAATTTSSSLSSASPDAEAEDPVGTAVGLCIGVLVAVVLAVVVPVLYAKRRKELEGRSSTVADDDVRKPRGGKGKGKVGAHLCEEDGSGGHDWTPGELAPSPVAVKDPRVFGGVPDFTAAASAADGGERPGHDDLSSETDVEVEKDWNSGKFIDEFINAAANTDPMLGATMTGGMGMTGGISGGLHFFGLYGAGRADDADDSSSTSAASAIAAALAGLLQLETAKDDYDASVSQYDSTSCSSTLEADLGGNYASDSATYVCVCVYACVFVCLFADDDLHALHACHTHVRRREIVQH